MLWTSLLRASSSVPSASSVLFEGEVDSARSEALALVGDSGFAGDDGLNTGDVGLYGMDPSPSDPGERADYGEG